jgi:hypothetical protein
MYLASPNPCPGTGSGWAGETTSNGVTTPGSVPFNTGDPNAYYTYPSGTLAKTRNYSMSSDAMSPTYMYPSMDLSLAAECTASKTLEVWPGELDGTGQHLHFFIFNRVTPSQNKYNMSLEGNQGQDFVGIFYTPHLTETITGNGQLAQGPPFIVGQIVTWDLTYSGSGAVDLVYRPCNPQAEVCSSGLGTQLVQ